MQCGLCCDGYQISRLYFVGNTSKWALMQKIRTSSPMVVFERIEWDTEWFAKGSSASLPCRLKLVLQPMLCTLFYFHY